MPAEEGKALAYLLAPEIDQRLFILSKVPREDLEQAAQTSILGRNKTLDRHDTVNTCSSFHPRGVDVCQGLQRIP